MALSSSIIRVLESSRNTDMSVPGRSSKQGSKLSIQGRTLEDAIQAYGILQNYLMDNSIAHKVGTLKRITHPNPIQSKKIITIYIPDDENPSEIAEEVYWRLHKGGYKGWYNIKDPPSYDHYAGAVWMRNDKDDQGRYIPANQKEYKMPRKWSKEHCESKTCDEMGFSERASCAPYKSCPSPKKVARLFLSNLNQVQKGVWLPLWEIAEQAGISEFKALKLLNRLKKQGKVWEDNGYWMIVR